MSDKIGVTTAQDCQQATSALGDGAIAETPCPICGGALNKRQTYCSTTCRVKGHRIREAQKVMARALELWIQEIRK